MNNHFSWILTLCRCCLGAACFALFTGLSHAQTTNTPAVMAPAQAIVADFQLQSCDRLLRGKIRVPDDWKHVSFRFVNVTTKQVLGTYPDVLEKMPTIKLAFNVYVHQQPVTFFLDNDDPKILHFASIFDQLGTVQVQVLRANHVIAYGEKKLVADAEFSSLMQSTDQAIGGPSANPPATKTPASDHK